MMETQTNLSVFVSDNSKKPPKFFTAHIQYKNIDGCHVFTSHQIEGLFIATRDPVKAKAQIVPTIKGLLKLETGTDFHVELSEEFSLDGSRKQPLVLEDACVVIQKDAA